MGNALNVYLDECLLVRRRFAPRPASWGWMLTGGGIVGGLLDGKSVLFALFVSRLSAFKYPRATSAPRTVGSCLDRADSITPYDV